MCRQSHGHLLGMGEGLNIQKTKIMASGPITSWEIDGETVETVADFIFWAPKSLQMVIAAMKLKDDLRADKMELSPEGYIRMLAGGNR